MKHLMMIALASVESKQDFAFNAIDVKVYQGTPTRKRILTPIRRKQTEPAQAIENDLFPNENKSERLSMASNLDCFMGFERMFWGK